MKVLPFVVPKPEKGGLIYQVDKVEVFYEKGYGLLSLLGVCFFIKRVNTLS